MRNTEAPGPRTGLAILRSLGRRLLRVPLGMRVLLVFAWMVLIWSLSDQDLPAPSEDPGVLWEVFANLGHAPLFGLLGLLLLAVCIEAETGGGWRVPSPSRVVFVLIWTGLYATLDEWHQTRTPGRDSSVFDIVTDLVGALSVLWIVAYLARPAANERGLQLRLLGGVLVCLAAACMATLA